MLTRLISSRKVSMKNLNCLWTFSIQTKLSKILLSLRSTASLSVEQTRSSIIHKYQSLLKPQGLRSSPKIILCTLNCQYQHIVSHWHLNPHSMNHPMIHRLVLVAAVTALQITLNPQQTKAGP
jgi:hypothetical protein